MEDGHAKNFSVFLLPGGAYRLTPRYDTLSAYPVLGHGRGKYAPEKITIGHGGAREKSALPLEGDRCATLDRDGQAMRIQRNAFRHSKRDYQDARSNRAGPRPGFA